MAKGYQTVTQPPLVPYSYGLFAAAAATGGILNDPEPHWQLGVQYDTDNCAQGGLWVPCDDTQTVFTVTLTRTANANEFQVIFNPAAGPYEASVDGGAFQAFSNGGTFVETTSPFTLIVRETTGLKRYVTITGILPGSPEGTVFVGSVSKNLEGMTTITGDAVTVYAGVDCKIVGLQDAPAMAARRLAAVEQRLIEQWVWERMLTIPAAVITNGSTPLPLKQGVGALETALGDRYGGVGVFHAADWSSAYLADRYQLVQDGTVKRTNLGNVWAFGRGYGTSSPTDVTPDPASGELWMYATGAVTIRRSEVRTPADTRSGGFSMSTNDSFVMAERTYVVTLDCPLVAVPITMAGEDPTGA